MNPIVYKSVREAFQRLLSSYLLFIFFLPIALGQTADLDKGKRLYLSTCIQCHNRNPNLKGPLGPELVDAPLEVMVSKVTTGKYPEKLPAGFTPKRKTTMMKKLPIAEKDIPLIHIWIQSLKEKKP